MAAWESDGSVAGPPSDEPAQPGSRLGPRGRGPRSGRGPAAQAPEPDGADRDRGERDELRERERPDDVVVAADELDQEALGAGQHEVEREEAARGHLVAAVPQ